MAELRRVALLWDFAAAPWAPIMLGFAEGLRAHGIDARCANAVADWCSAEIVRQFDPDAVIVGLHHALRPHVAPWVQSVGAGRAWVSLCFDDPYDMATSLDLGQFFDLMLTPEPCAVEIYERRGWRADVIAPTVSTVWHHPPTAARELVHDVLHVGGNQWKPRRTWLPVLAQHLQAAGRQLTQATGGRRGFLCGRELTHEMHRARLAIDIPRDEWFPTTNPHFVPCTYTGPRVHIAAACGTPILCVNPRGDLEATYPANPTALLDGDGTAAIGRVLELLTMDDVLRATAAAAVGVFEQRHAPRVRAKALMDHVHAYCLSGQRVHA